MRARAALPPDQSRRRFAVAIGDGVVASIMAARRSAHWKFVESPMMKCREFAHRERTTLIGPLSGPTLGLAILSLLSSLCHSIPAFGADTVYPLKSVRPLTFVVDYEPFWSPDGQQVV